MDHLPHASALYQQVLKQPRISTQELKDLDLGSCFLLLPIHHESKISSHSLILLTSYVCFQRGSFSSVVHTKPHSVTSKRERIYGLYSGMTFPCFSCIFFTVEVLQMLTLCSQVKGNPQAYHFSNFLVTYRSHSYKYYYPPEKV